MIELSREVRHAELSSSVKAGFQSENFMLIDRDSSDILSKAQELPDTDISVWSRTSDIPTVSISCTDMRKNRGEQRSTMCEAKGWTFGLSKLISSDYLKWVNKRWLDSF